MIPLKDENPTTRTAFVTLVLVIACAAVWLLVQQGQDTHEEVEFVYEYAAIPCEVLTREPLEVAEVRDPDGCEDTSTGTPEIFPDKSIWRSVFVSMFLHGGIVHLGGNLLFLWIFGNNIEDRLGHVAYLGFYLAGGVVATLAHVLVNADSTVPLVGASGAIAAVMGAYMVWYPYARIKTVVFLFLVFFTEVQARWLLGFWLVLQFFTSDNSGVAWVAHVGGFAFGVLAGLLIGPRRRRPAMREAYRSS